MDETHAEEADDTPAAVPPVEVEASKEEDSSAVEEKSVELVSSGPEEAAIVEDKKDKEEAMPHAVETE